MAGKATSAAAYPASTDDAIERDGARGGDVRLVRWKGYLLPYFTTVAIVAVNLLAYRLASSLWGKEMWAEYSLIRRFVSLMEPVFLMGFGLGIARQVSLAENHPGGRRPLSFFLVAVMISYGALLPFLVGANLWPHFTAWICFGSASRTHLVFPMTLALAGSMLNSLCYPFLQGRMFIQRASLLLLLNNCLVPLAAFIWFNDSVATLFVSQGILVLTTSAIVATAIFARSGKLGGDGLVAHAKSLVSYAYRRLPCDLGIAFLLNTPAFFAIHLAGLDVKASKDVGGAVGFGTTLLSLVASAIAPFAFLLLPQATRLLGRGDYATLRAYVGRLLSFYVAAGILTVGCGEVLIAWVIGWYLGETFVSTHVPVLRILLVACFPFLIYCGLRSVVDASTHRAINARNTWIGIGVGAITWAALHLAMTGVVPVLAATVVSWTVLGVLTVVEVRRIVSGLSPAELEV